MAYTITQKPTTPNAAYTRLPYVVSGSANTAKPQFQYVMDVYESGSTVRLQRTTQQINPAGVAVFDPSRIMQAQLAQDDSWKINGVEAFLTSSRTFTLEFGESFASSLSSSATTVDNIARTNTEVFRGVVEPNNGIGYNWQSSSYAVLSNMPATMSMQTNDYGTISVYKNGAASTVSQSFYSASLPGSSILVQSKNYSVTDNFSSIPISSSTPYWNYAEVNVSSSLGIQSYRYEASDETHREKTRFAFINKLGTWDYYNNYNPVKQSIDIQREQYTSPRVDYSSLTSTYDITRRGRSDYYNSTDDGFSVMSDYLDKTNANWLEELIESPSVYIQRDGVFLPIVITDTSYTANTNQARQKLFQYTINFTPANQPYGKWVPEYVQCPKSGSISNLFDPYLNGSIATSTLKYWYDFTDTGSMVLITSASYPETAISGIHNKGYEPSASLFRGPQTLNKYSSDWIPPLYEGEYTSFRTNATTHSNSSLTARYAGVENTPFMHSYPIIATGSTFTSIMFVRPHFMTGTNSTVINAIDFMMSSSVDAPYARPETVDFYTTANKSFDLAVLSGSYLSTAKSTFSSSFNLTGGNIGYSYSGSGATTSPWESKVIVKISSGSTGYVTRDFATSASYDGNYISQSTPFETLSYENLTIGTEAQTNNSAGNRFDIAHLLIYTGSLSQTVIQNVITSFSQSVSYGNELNAIDN